VNRARKNERNDVSWTFVLYGVAQKAKNRAPFSPSSPGLAGDAFRGSVKQRWDKKSERVVKTKKTTLLNAQ